MDDLISRAAAIEALGECPYNWTDSLEEIAVENAWYRYKDAIEHVSAVDAIPVEWLREKMKIPTMTCANPFDYVFCEWMNEQEAR